jgi:AcrR family transcriptional regulator
VFAVQKLHHEKRDRILAAATELFASRPFHKVLLNDVAVEAAVGKGTLYTYFENKESLYLAVLYSSFEKLVDQLKRCVDADGECSPREALETTVREFVDYGLEHPRLLDLLRAGPLPPAAYARWSQQGRELTDLVEAIVRRGIALGQFADPHPELTARFVPALIRAALVDSPGPQDPQIVTRHILRFLESSLLPTSESCCQQ